MAIHARVSGLPFVHEEESKDRQAVDNDIQGRAALSGVGMRRYTCAYGSG